MENQNLQSPSSSPPPPPPPPPPPQEEPNSKKLKLSTTTTTNSDDEDRTTTNTEKKLKYKRRKIAILFAYCGLGYQGMQINPGAKTIEGDLEEALYFSGAVPETDRGYPNRFDFARSARTDKGVSAVGQVVSGRFYVDPPGFIERLNNNLPDQFRIFGFKRVTSSFSARKFCDRRRYVYLLPVFALDPSSHRDRESVLASLGSENELVKCLECSERGRKVESQVGISSNTLCAVSDSDGKQENESSVDDGIDVPVIVKCNSLKNSSALDRNLDNNSSSDAVNGDGKENVFLYGDKEKERLNKILKQYVGTHNFHNFTTRTKAADPSAKRYIISFHANTTVTVDGIEFVKCEVVGQSFMLHQIRKMIGVAVAIMRNFAPESLIETALQQDVRITVPTAPEVGLYLDECFFSSYNQKWKDTHEEVSMKAYAEEAEEFKLKYIYSHIASTEHKEGAVAVWLHSLNYRNYPDLCPKENSGANGAEETSGCNQKANPYRKADTLLDLVSSGRFFIQPLDTKITVAEIDLEHLATTLKNRLNLVFPSIPGLVNRYSCGPETDFTNTLISDINMMVDTAMSVTYNRLRSVLECHDSNVFVTRMNPRSPISNRIKFPAFISSVLGSIGPLRIKDGPKDMYLVYATSAERCRNYGRAQPFNFVCSQFNRFIENLEAVGVPLAPIDVKARDHDGSFFSTIIQTLENNNKQYSIPYSQSMREVRCRHPYLHPRVERLLPERPPAIQTLESGLVNFKASFHHSHYKHKDIMSAWLTMNDNPTLRTFEDCSLTIGRCTDPGVVEAVISARSENVSEDIRQVGGVFPVNGSGIQPEVAAEGGNPGAPAAVYIVGRGSEVYYGTSLARNICESEMFSMLFDFIFMPSQGNESF